MRLTDKQWSIIEPFFSSKMESLKREKPVYIPREVLEGILWVMRTGARWDDIKIPQGYPSGSTCSRYFHKWVEEGLYDKVIRKLVEDLRDRGKIDLTETFIDATFVDPKKESQKSVNLKVAKGARSWQSLTIDLFLSPCLMRVLHHMRVRSLSERFGEVILGTYLCDLLETKLTILIFSGKAY